MPGKFIDSGGVVSLTKTSLATTVWTKTGSYNMRVSGDRPWTGLRSGRSSKSTDDIHHKEPDMGVIEACLNCPYSNCRGDCDRIKEAIKSSKSSKPRRLVKRGEIPREFAELYIAGTPRQELREKYQVSDSTIGRWTKRLGLKRNLEQTKAHK